MINYKITLEYDGSRYNGWQRQGNTDNTIQGKLEALLSRYFGQDIEIHGSGRTDAGVHALGQVANFKVDYKNNTASSNIDSEDTTALRNAINGFLPEDIRITSMSIADNRFHARLNAKSKLYRYRICLSDTNKRSVFDRKYCAILTEPASYSKCETASKPKFGTKSISKSVSCLDLDIDAMKSASTSFLGEHDFGAFSDTKTKKSTVRYVESITFSTEKTATDTYLVVDFKGNGFLYHTVRLMMGTLIRIGQGECSADIIDKIFATNNRKLVPFTAPAEGLFLVEVEY